MVAIDTNNLRATDVEDYLTIARRLSHLLPVVDSHIHATEVVLRSLTKGVSPNRRKIYRQQKPLAAVAIRLNEETAEVAKMDQRSKNQISRLSINRAYANMNLEVLQTQMRFAGVTRALLLPVATPNNPIENQLHIINEFTDSDPNLMFAYSIYPRRRSDDVEEDVISAFAKLKFSAVKLHPNLSGFDICSWNNWILRVLNSCEKVDVPLIIHGGKSPIIENEERSQFSTLKKLRHINWSTSKAKVVIAHFGMYGYSREEIELEQINYLHEILARHSNVYLDTSGLEFSSLKFLLSRIEHERVIFGSDALYSPIWKSIVLLLHCLSILTEDYEASFVRITSDNPCDVLNIKKP